MEKIILIGNGGHSRVIRDLISAEGRFEIFAILDDQFTKVINSEILYAPISYIKELEKISELKVALAIGNNKIRKKIVEQLKLPSNKYVALIHPTAIISPSVKIGCGTVIMPKAVINANTVIGNHVIINSSAVVEHDNYIEDFAHIAPNVTLTGSVRVGRGTQISAAASVIPGITIGDWCMIGAGSTVIQNIPSCCKAVGSPAKVIERFGEGSGQNEKENSPFPSAYERRRDGIH